MTRTTYIEPETVRSETFQRLLTEGLRKHVEPPRYAMDRKGDA
jgi:hypothetical protein